MKRWTALLLLCVMLPLCAASESAGPSAMPAMRRVADNLFYIPSLHRYVNDAAMFPIRRMEGVVAQINALLDAVEPPVSTYLYFVESSRSHPMQAAFNEKSVAYRYLLKNLHVDHADHLKYTTFRQFCAYFFATDHHWNHQGAYQGYTDIVRMLLGEDEPLLTPAQEVTLPVLFNGSYAKEMGTALSQEHFALYRFDPMPACTAYVNGRKKAYGHLAEYLNGKVPADTYANHYSICYGGDVGFMVLEGQNKNGRTLLLIGNSMSNAVKALLSAHYETIVCVDLRHYQRDTQRPFSLNRTIQEYGADQVLLLGDAGLFLVMEK